MAKQLDAAVVKDQASEGGSGKTLFLCVLQVFLKKGEVKG